MLVLSQVGCVRRRLTVRTNPANAMVYVDRQLVGPSPASTPFTFYGTRHIEVVGDGYRTEKILRTFTPPWYQIPPLDFITETLWPWEIRDERVIDVTMVPDEIVPSEALEERAEQLRLQATQRIATPLPPSQTTTGAPQNIPTSTPNVAGPFDNSGLFPASTGPVLPPWQPGQILRNILQPGGQPPERIPAVGGLQGGGYRPEITATP